MAIARTHILVCGGTGCSSSHSQALIDELNRELEEKGLLGEVQVIKTGCFGLCALGPVVVVYPEGCFYSHVTEADIPEIVEEHILKGRIVIYYSQSAVCSLEHYIFLRYVLSAVNGQFLHSIGNLAQTACVLKRRRYMQFNHLLQFFPI